MRIRIDESGDARSQSVRFSSAAGHATAVWRGQRLPDPGDHDVERQPATMDDLVTNSIGVWRLLPPETAPAIADWRFDSPQMLRQELRRAWNEAVIPHVVPLWDEDGRLAALIAEQNDELGEAHKRSMDDRLLRHARAEFDAGRFANAVHAYDELADEQLTPADHKRLEIARRRL
jgi:hypothetical protein